MSPYSSLDYKDIVVYNMSKKQTLIIAGIVGCLSYLLYRSRRNRPKPLSIDIAPSISSANIWSNHHTTSSSSSLFSGPSDDQFQVLGLHSWTNSHSQNNNPIFSHISKKVSNDYQQYYEQQQIQ